MIIPYDRKGLVIFQNSPCLLDCSLNHISVGPEASKNLALLAGL